MWFSALMVVLAFLLVVLAIKLLPFVFDLLLGLVGTAAMLAVVFLGIAAWKNYF